MLTRLQTGARKPTIAELGAVPLEDAPKMRAQTQALEKLLAAHLRSKEAKLEAANNLTEARLRIERHTGALIPKLQKDGLLASQDGYVVSNAATPLMVTLTDYAIVGFAPVMHGPVIWPSAVPPPVTPPMPRLAVRRARRRARQSKTPVPFLTTPYRGKFLAVIFPLPQMHGIPHRAARE